MCMCVGGVGGGEGNSHVRCMLMVGVQVPSMHNRFETHVQSNIRCVLVVVVQVPRHVGETNSGAGADRVRHG